MVVAVYMIVTVRTLIARYLLAVFIRSYDGAKHRSHEPLYVYIYLYIYICVYIYIYIERERERE